jgi:hypothetical protein
MADITRTAGPALDALIKMSDDLASIDVNDYQMALQAALPEAEKVARREMLRTYNNSAVKTRTGKLKSLIANALVTIGNFKGTSWITIGLQAGASKEDYIAANSVNYGRVNSKDFGRTTEKVVRGISGQKVTKQYRTVGDKRRKKLKSNVQSGSTKSNIARGMTLTGAKVGRTKAGSAKVETSLGSATITKAFNCFTLKAGQKALIRNALIERTLQILRERFRRALAA